MILSEDKEKILTDILLEKVAVINLIEASWEISASGEHLPPILLQIDSLEKERPKDGRGIILPHPYSLMALELFRNEGFINHPFPIYTEPITYEIRSKIVSLLSIYKRFLIWTPKNFQIDLSELQEKDLIRIMPKIDYSSEIEYYDIAPYKPYMIAYFQSNGFPCNSVIFDNLLDENLDALNGKVPTNPIAEIILNCWADVRIYLWASKMTSLPLFTMWSMQQNTSEIERISKLLHGHEMNTRINVMIKTILSQEDTSNIPSLKMAINYRNKSEFLELHQKLEKCINVFDREQSLELWNEEVQKATTDVRRSRLFKKFSGFCTYASVPLTLLDLTTGIPAGTSISIIGAGLQLGGDTLNKKSRWVLFGS